MALNALEPDARIMSYLACDSRATHSLSDAYASPWKTHLGGDRYSQGVGYSHAAPSVVQAPVRARLLCGFILKLYKYFRNRSECDLYRSKSQFFDNRVPNFLDDFI